FGTGRVDLAIVKALALVRIAQQIIGRSDFLELVFGGVITRIKIRMQFLRQLPICLLDVGRRSSGRNAKKLVRICHDLHRLACGCALGLVSPEKHEVIAAQVADRSVYTPSAQRVSLPGRLFVADRELTESRRCWWAGGQGRQGGPVRGP